MKAKVGIASLHHLLGACWPPSICSFSVFSRSLRILTHLRIAVRAGEEFWYRVGDFFSAVFMTAFERARLDVACFVELWIRKYPYFHLKYYERMWSSLSNQSRCGKPWPLRYTIYEFESLKLCVVSHQIDLRLWPNFLSTVSFRICTNWQISGKSGFAEHRVLYTMLLPSL